MELLTLFNAIYEGYSKSSTSYLGPKTPCYLLPYKEAPQKWHKWIFCTFEWLLYIRNLIYFCKRYFPSNEKKRHSNVKIHNLFMQRVFSIKWKKTLECWWKLLSNSTSNSISFKFKLKLIFRNPLIRSTLFSTRSNIIAYSERPPLY